MRLPIPDYAKENARKALELRNSLPESKKFGLDKKEARELNIASGVERAQQIIREESLSRKDAERVCAFKRFDTPNPSQRRKGALNLWGGSKFIRKACDFLRREK